MRGDISLTASASEDDSWSLQDRIADPGADPESLLCETEARLNRAKQLNDAMAGLTAREREIIVGRYLSETPQTLGELGRRLKVSGERIRQIETRALQKIKEAISSRHQEIEPA